MFQLSCFMKKFLPALVLISLLVVPVIGFTQGDDLEPGQIKQPGEAICEEVRHDLSQYIGGCSPESFDPEMDNAQLCCILDIMETVVDWMFVILLILSAIIIIIAAFQFVTAGGAPEKVTSARDKMIWALVGVAVAFLAKGLVRLIEMLIT